MKRVLVFCIAMYSSALYASSLGICHILKSGIDRHNSSMAEILGVSETSIARLSMLFVQDEISLAYLSRIFAKIRDEHQAFADLKKYPPAVIAKYTDFVATMTKKLKCETSEAVTAQELLDIAKQLEIQPPEISNIQYLEGQSISPNGYDVRTLSALNEIRSQYISNRSSLSFPDRIIETWVGEFGFDNIYVGRFGPHRENREDLWMVLTDPLSVNLKISHVLTAAQVHRERQEIITGKEVDRNFLLAVLKFDEHFVKFAGDQAQLDRIINRFEEMCTSKNGLSYRGKSVEATYRLLGNLIKEFP